MENVRSAPRKARGLVSLMLVPAVFLGVLTGIAIQRSLVTAGWAIQPSPVKKSTVSISDQFGLPYLARESAPSLASLEEREMYARLTAWEARFDRVKIGLISEAGISELVNWPGASSYFQSNANTSVGVHLDGSDFWQFDLHDGRIAGATRYHGTEMGANLDVLRASVRPTLYDLGVFLVGDVKMSDAYLFAKERIVTKLPNGVLRAIFAPPPDTKFNHRVRVDMARGALGLAEWAVITENLESVRELKPLQESFTEWLPTSIHYRTSEADGNIVSRAGNTIRSVTPLPVAPTLPVIPADVFIKDQATGLQVRSGGLDALEITKVRKVLSYSATGAPLDGGEGRSARCGPDCLTYMLWLTDKSPAPADVLRLFNGVEDGVTLLEIRDAAQKIGLRLIGLRGIDGGLENLQLPAILSTTNTHFVVAVSATKNGFVVIDPPYTVRIVSSDELSKLWSGYALTLEGSEG